MKLFDLDHSPYAARVRVAIRAKGLDVALVPPPGGALSADYRALSPIGLVPALELDDGTVLPEAQVILEYLEDARPDPPLRPASPDDRAQVRLLAQIVDIYLADALKRLFEHTKKEDTDAGRGDPETLSADRDAVRAALGYVETYLGRHRDGTPYAIGDHLTTADCALATMLFFAERARAPLGPPDPFAPETALGAYWRGIAADPHVRAVLDGMAEAQARRARQRAAGKAED